MEQPPPLNTLLASSLGALATPHGADGLIQHICAHTAFQDRSPDELRLLDMTVQAPSEPKFPAIRDATLKAKMGMYVSTDTTMVLIHSSDILAWCKEVEQHQSSCQVALANLEQHPSEDAESKRASILLNAKSVPALFNVKRTETRWAFDDPAVAVLIKAAKSSPDMTDWMELHRKTTLPLQGSSPSARSTTSYSLSPFNKRASLASTHLSYLMFQSCREASDLARKHSEPLWMTSEILSMGSYTLNVLAHWLDTVVRPAPPDQLWFQLPQLCPFDHTTHEFLPRSFPALPPGVEIKALFRHSCVFTHTCFAIELAIAHQRRHALGGVSPAVVAVSNHTPTTASQPHRSHREKQREKKEKKEKEKDNRRAEEQAGIANLNILDLHAKWYLRPCAACRQLPSSGFFGCKHGAGAVLAKSAEAPAQMTSALLEYHKDAVALKDRGILCNFGFDASFPFSATWKLNKLLDECGLSDALTKREQEYVSAVNTHLARLRTRASQSERDTIDHHAAYLWLLEVQHQLNQTSSGRTHYIFRFIWDERLLLHAGSFFLRAILVTLLVHFECHGRTPGWQRKQLIKVRHQPLTSKVYASNEHSSWFAWFVLAPGQLPYYHQCFACHFATGSIAFHANHIPDLNSIAASMFLRSPVVCRRMAHLWTVASRATLQHMHQWMVEELSIIDAALREKGPLDPTGVSRLRLVDICGNTEPRCVVSMVRAAPKQQEHHLAAGSVRAYRGKALPFNLAYLHVFHACSILLAFHEVAANFNYSPNVRELVSIAINDVLMAPGSDPDPCKTGACFACQAFTDYRPMQDSIRMMTPMEVDVDIVTQEDCQAPISTTVSESHPPPPSPPATLLADQMPSSTTSSQLPDAPITSLRTCGSHSGSSTRALLPTTARYRVCCSMGTETYLHKACFRRVFKDESRSTSGSCPDSDCVTRCGGPHALVIVEAWDNDQRLRKVLLTTPTPPPTLDTSSVRDESAPEQTDDPLESEQSTDVESDDNSSVESEPTPTLPVMPRSAPKQDMVQLRDTDSLVQLVSEKTIHAAMAAAEPAASYHRSFKAKSKAKKQMSLQEFHVCADAQAELNKTLLATPMVVCPTPTPPPSLLCALPRCVSPSVATTNSSCATTPRSPATSASSSSSTCESSNDRIGTVEFGPAVHPRTHATVPFLPSTHDRSVADRRVLIWARKSTCGTPSLATSTTLLREFDEMRRHVAMMPIQSEIHRVFPVNVCAIARVHGLNVDAIAVYLSRPLKWIKIDLQFGLFTLSSFEVFTLVQWSQLMDPRHSTPCPFFFSEQAACKKQKVCNHSHDAEYAARVIEFRHEQTMLAWQHGIDINEQVVPIRSKPMLPNKPRVKLVEGTHTATTPWLTKTADDEWKFYKAPVIPGIKTRFMIMHVSAGCYFMQQPDVTKVLDAIQLELLQLTSSATMRFRWHVCTDHITLNTVIFLQFHSMKEQARWDQLPTAAIPSASKVPHLYVLPNTTSQSLWSTIQPV